MRKIALTYKDVMLLIYMRTALELKIESVDKNHIPNKHNLTRAGLIAYNRIVFIERTIISSKMNEQYQQALQLAKDVWAKSLDICGENYAFYIEPFVASIYSLNEKRFKLMGLISKPFFDLYDQYFLKHDCDLEVESIKPIEVLTKETEKAIFEFKKEQKRKA